MDISLTQVTNLLCKMADWHKINDGHDDRVMKLAVEMGARLNYDSEQIAMLRHTARLHDIGRVGIPNDIMAKVGPLIDAERAAIKDHPRQGYEIIKELYPPEVALGVLHHHENWDGTGYPDCLKGDAIPEFAQIIRIADSWDALRNHRPYREALSFENALHIMNLDKSYFSPRLYPLFLDIVRKGNY